MTKNDMILLLGGMGIVFVFFGYLIATDNYTQIEIAKIQAGCKP